MFFDWRAFFNVVGAFFVAMWAAAVIGGTFLYDRMPLWAVAAHIAISLASVGVAGAIKLKEQK